MSTADADQLKSLVGELRPSGLGFRVQGEAVGERLGLFGVSGWGFKGLGVGGLGFRVLGFRVYVGFWGLEFGGLGFRV